MKFKTNDGRVKTCHRHKPRYNGNMKKNEETKSIIEKINGYYKQYKQERIINFLLNIIIAFGVTCNLILNIVK